MSTRALQALILAAGRGTRMRCAQAKVLHPLLGLPLLEHVVRSVAAVGADPIHLVVGHHAPDVEVAFAGRGLVLLRQDPPRGTGHAVHVAREAVAAHPERSLLVVNGDLPLLRAETLRTLAAAHEDGVAATLLTATLEDGGPYGRVLRGAGRLVRAIVEARDASEEERAIREINAGVYLFDVPALLTVLDRLTPENAQGEYYLTDVVALLARQGRRVEGVPAGDSSEVLGVNTHAELADVARRLRERVLGSLMDAGVAVEDPATTWVGPDVVAEADAVIRPFTILEGRTVLRSGASVGPFARLVDTEVGRGAQVLDHCLLRESVVEAGASVGPFAHVRPESHIGVKARVGNFVELKKTRLGEGSKAPHLSYLGDATIGPGVNVGAGTITCNYDGVTKHPTRIEAGAFIGSDTTLVAPLTVGEGAYVAAGSTLTEDVPPDALALGRARQVVKEGWARRRREQRQKEKAKG